MNKANECTCPSGDGSLVHPCPAHPAVDQADVAAKLTFINGRPAMCGCQVEYSDGGGEYSDVIYVTLCAKHSGSAILDLVATNRIALTPEYEGQWHADLYLDREIPLAKVEGATPAEAVLALMSAERIDPEQESVEQAGGERRDALQSIMEWTAAENIPDDRKLCLIRNAARAALAQPSPAQAEQHWPKLEKPVQVGAIRFHAGLSSRLVVEAAQRLYEFESTPEKEAERIERLQAFREQLDPLNLAPHAGAFNEAPAEALKPEPAEAERPEVVGYRTVGRHAKHQHPHYALNYYKQNAEDQAAHWRERGCEVSEDELMTVAQHAASVARWAEMFNRVEQERDAANARLHEVATACATAEQERDAALARVADMKTMADNYCALLMDANAKLAEMERQEPVALANRGLHAFWVKWTEAAAGLYGPGIKLYANPVAQAQHSVPGNAAALVRAEGKKYSLNAAGMLDSGAPEHAQTFAIVQLLSEFDDEEAESHWEAIMAYSDFRTSDALFHAAELLAAAPGKEGNDD
ncbi:hypothetical protein ACSO6A_001508 [Pseudomonas aeruginosa]